jgi:predicted kinase
MAAADPELVVRTHAQLPGEASPYGDECDQNATPAAVKQLHSQLDQQLAAGRHVLVDATNSHAADRCALLRIASRHQAATIAVVALPPLGEVLARNATRSPVVGPCGSARRVPEETVTAMHHRITADLHNLAAEGWRRVIMLSRTDALLAGDPYD